MAAVMSKKNRERIFCYRKHELCHGNRHSNYRFFTGLARLSTSRVRYLGAL